MNSLRKTFWPAAFLAAFLMFSAVAGPGSNQAFADDEGIDKIVPSDSVVGVGPFVVYAVINHDPDFEYSVEVDNETGAADIIRKLNGSSSGDLDNVGPTKELNIVTPVDICNLDESLRIELEALGLDFNDFDECEDTVVLVVVLCEELGTFDISFSNQDDNTDSASTELECRGNPDQTTVTASPSKVEIVPQVGSTDVSTITVEIFDSNGSPALVGGDVLFLTDNCLLDDGVNPQASSVSIVSVDVDGDTIAEVDLDCSNSSAEPRPATVQILIDKPGHDLVLDIAVIVIGPPVPSGLSAVASPETIICGEKSEILISVQDAIGQNVSDNTELEVVTNFGGVLGGTGAVAEGEGNVTPLSSTTVKTFDGIALVFLITSDTHVGDYEVVISTGGRISEGLLEINDEPTFTTQVTVACTAAGGSSQPTTTAPATGNGNSITPPSTGDAGLMTGSKDVAIILIAGAAMLALLGLTRMRLIRR